MTARKNQDPEKYSKPIAHASSFHTIEIVALSEPWLYSDAVYRIISETQSEKKGKVHLRLRAFVLHTNGQPRRDVHNSHSTKQKQNLS